MADNDNVWGLDEEFEDDFEEDPEEDIEELSVMSLEIDEDAPQPDYDSEDSVKESSFSEVVCQPCRDDEIAKLKGENALLKLKLKLREEEAEGAKFNLEMKYNVLYTSYINHLKDCRHQKDKAARVLEIVRRDTRASERSINFICRWPLSRCPAWIKRITTDFLQGHRRAIATTRARVTEILEEH